MAMGALSACKAAGRTDVVIGGVDGLEDAIQAVKDGELGVSVLQDSAGQGEGAVEVGSSDYQRRRLSERYTYSISCDHIR